MKKLLIVLSALLMLVAVSCSNDTPAAPSAGLDGTDLTITVPSVDEDNIAPDVESVVFDYVISYTSNLAESSETGFGSGYDAEGNKVYAYEDGVYTIGVAEGSLTVGDEVEYDVSDITVNGRQYSTTTSDEGIAYSEDWTKLQEKVVLTIQSEESYASYRRCEIPAPVLDEEGNLTYHDIEVEKVDENGDIVLDENGDPVMETKTVPVTETVLSTIDYSWKESTTTETYANGGEKTTTVSEERYDLSQAVCGVTSMTLYTTEVEFKPIDGDRTSLYESVLVVTRDGETSTYAY